MELALQRQKKKHSHMHKVNVSNIVQNFLAVFHAFHLQHAYMQCELKSHADKQTRHVLTWSESRRARDELRPRKTGETQTDGWLMQGIKEQMGRISFQMICFWNCIKALNCKKKKKGGSSLKAWSAILFFTFFAHI